MFRRDSKVFRVVVVVVLLLTALTAARTAPAQAQRACPDQAAFDAAKANFLGILNDARAKAGLSAMSYNGLLDQAALLHSQDMVAQQYFDHTGKDGSQPWDRTKRIGYAGGFIGENIAINPSPDAQGVFTSWWNSPGHKANMMNPDYNIMGFGQACGDWNGNAGYVYSTQVLSKDESAPGGNTGGGDNTGGGNTGGGDTGGGNTGGGDTGGGDTGGGDTGGGGDSGGDAGNGAEGEGEGDWEFSGAAPGTGKKPSDGASVTATGEALNFASGAVMITLPKDWTYIDRMEADGEVDYESADKAVSGYFGYYSASESGITTETDLVVTMANWAVDVGSTVTPAMAMDAGALKGAVAVVKDGDTVILMYVLYNSQTDSIVYGEFWGAESAIVGNQVLSGIISSVVLPLG